MSAHLECPTAYRMSRDGIVHLRLEHEVQLYTGMKDLFGYLVVESGASRLWHRGRTHAVEPGDLVLLEPGEIYRDQHRDGPSTFELVLFDPAHVAPILAKRTEFHSPVLSASDTRALPLLALREQLAGEASGVPRADFMEDAVRALMDAGATRARSPRVARPAIVRAQAYLRARLSEAVRLDDLADHVRLDKYHLIRAFRTEIGVPPYEYLTQLRMVRARALLRAGRSSTEVAAALGYCDQSQFHRHFVRIVGTTPGAFARIG